MAITPVLDIAARALRANEAALGVVGENIANVDTPGYTRQLPDFEADPETPSAGGITFGQGVHLRGVDQVLDPLLAKRQLAAGSDAGEQQAVSDQLDQLATIVNDLADPSLASAVTDFFDGADALAQNPGGLAERETLLARAGALASQLNARSASIASLQRSVDDRIVAQATQANDTLARIARLNAGIVATEVTGQRANVLRDQRAAALADLAQQLRITTVEEPGGAVTVTAGNGAVLVAAGEVVHGIGVQVGGAGLDGAPLHTLGLTDASGFLSVPAAFARGGLAGLVSARDGALVTASRQLDTLVDGDGVNPGLRDAVNAIQQTGFDLDGNPTTAEPLFAGTGAAGLTVALSDPRKLAAAKTTDPGDNQNALALADLRTATLPALGGTSFAGYLASETNRVGEEAARAKDAATASSLFAKQLDDQHASISGVNLNEELTNLLRYQHAFQAAAQVLNVGNQVLDDLLHLVS